MLLGAFCAAVVMYANATLCYICVHVNISLTGLVIKYRNCAKNMHKSIYHSVNNKVWSVTVRLAAAWSQPLAILTVAGVVSENVAFACFSLFL